MERRYLIKKDNKICYIKYEVLDGLSFKPLNEFFVNDGVVVAKIVVFKPEFIESVLKKKIKNKLNLYLNLILSDAEDDGSDDPEYVRAVMDDVSRYKALVTNKYRKYLEDRYYEALQAKISIIEEELKAKLLYLTYEKEEVKESKRSR
ncbi:MAG: hypothetical protein IJ565_01000 [Bacilli bacterium]|nr:hypothetical protein [Bacilli bacterium]